MAINIDIITRLRERQLTADAERIKREVQKAGDEAGRAWDKSVVRAFRNTEKAAEGVVKAQEKVTRANEGLTKSSDGIAASLDRNTAAVHNWDEALKAQEQQTARTQAAQAAYNAELFKAEPNLKRVRQLERELAEERRALDDANWRLVRSGQEIAASNRTQRDAIVANARAQRDYEESLRVVERAQRDVIRASADFDGAVDKAAARMRQAESAGGSLGNIIQDIGTVAFRTGRGLGTIAAPAALLGFIEIGRTALAASQSIALLPAAAAAGAAGLGTLKLATWGFSDAIENMRDPEKFAEALALLGPNAQQAALHIQRLLPQFDALRHATSDAFFAGFDEQINRLTTQYLPSVQELTTGIATSMNQAMTGVANQLMTPETQAALQQTFNNIGVFFQNLAPAAQSLTQAFADIAASGSEFLPGFAVEISNAAANFAAFIREARASGELDRWIQQGVDAVKELSTVLWEVVQIVYRVFGPETDTLMSGSQEGVNNLTESWQSFEVEMYEIRDIIGLLTLDGETWGRVWKTQLDSMEQGTGGLSSTLALLRDGIMDIPEAFAWLVNKVVDGINWMGQNAHNFLDAITPEWMGEALQPAPFTPIPKIDTGWANDWGGHQTPSIIDDFGGDNAGARQRERRGLPPKPGDPGFRGDRGPGSLAVPPPPPGGGAPSDRERLDAIRAGLDPNAYRVDPFAQVPGLPAVPLPANAGLPGSYNPNLVEPQEALEARQKVEAEARDLEEQRKNRMALELDSQSTAEQINDAKWKELEEAQQLQKAQYDLAEKLQGSARNMNNGMDELGAALDKDLGISKGLAGMADNLVRFLASMAMAPMLGQLNAIKNASPSQGGHGLMGILGAQGVFGEQFTGLPEDVQGNPAVDFGGATGYQFPGAGGASSPVQGADWEQLAQFESSGNWAINSGNGFSGGLQFTPETWSRYKPAGAPEAAWMATKEQQIAAAEAVLKAQGPQAWPAAFAQHPEWFQPRSSGTPPINSGTSPVGTIATGNIPASSYSDAGLVPAAARMNDIIPALFPGVTDIGGFRSDPHPDHPSGRALDIMTEAPGHGNNQPSTAGGLALGNQIWQWMESTGVFDMQGSLWQTKDHFNHIHARIKEGMEEAIPNLVNGAVSGVYGDTSTASFAGGTIPIPLPVTIVGGGAGAPVPGGAATTSGTAPKPGAPGAPKPGAPAGAPGAPGGPSLHDQGKYAHGPAKGQPWQFRPDGSMVPWDEAVPNGASTSGGPPPAGGAPSPGAPKPWWVTPPTGQPAGTQPGTLPGMTVPDIAPPSGVTPPTPPQRPGTVRMPAADAEQLAPNRVIYPNGDGTIDVEMSPSGYSGGGSTFGTAPPPLPPAHGTVMAPGAARSEQHSQVGLPGPGESAPFGRGNLPPLSPEFGGAPGIGGAVAAGGGVFAPPAGGPATPLPPAHAPGGLPGPPPSQYGGLAPQGGTGAGGVGITPGGTVDTAINLAASAFPGVGQAAATGIKLANRAIQFGGQVAGIMTQGAMETFLPTGASELAQNSWLTRIVGGLAGAAPALPNVAGKSPNALQPNQVQQQQQQNPMPQPQPNQVNVHYESHGQTEDRAGADLAYHLQQTHSPSPLTGSR